jgi:hypothetical protein
VVCARISNWWDRASNCGIDRVVDRFDVIALVCEVKYRGRI